MRRISPSAPPVRHSCTPDRYIRRGFYRVAVSSSRLLVFSSSRLLVFSSSRLLVFSSSRLLVFSPRNARGRTSQHHQALRRSRGGPRALADRAEGDGLRAARTQRRRQDDLHPDAAQHHRARRGSDPDQRHSQHGARGARPRRVSPRGARTLQEDAGAAPAALSRGAQGNRRARRRRAHRSMARPARACATRRRTGARRRSTSCRAGCSRRCSSSGRCSTTPTW